MFLLSPLEFARYIDDFQSPWVGSYFDVGNIVNYGWPEQWIRILGKRILKVDVKEYSRKIRDEKGPGAGFGAELGEGDCDWPAVHGGAWTKSDIAAGGPPKSAAATATDWRKSRVAWTKSGPSGRSRSGWNPDWYRARPDRCYFFLSSLRNCAQVRVLATSLASSPARRA